MNTTIKKRIVIGVALAGILGASRLHAVEYTYTVNAWGPVHLPGPYTAPDGSAWGEDGYPGDLVGLEGITGTIDLFDGAEGDIDIGLLTWTGFYTWGSPTDSENDWLEFLPIAFSTSRGISIGSGSGSLDQDGLLVTGWYDDDLSLDGGLTASISVGGFIVDVTPLALDSAYASWSGPQPNGVPLPSRMVTAHYTVTASDVPEAGSTLAMFGLAVCCLAGFGGAAKRRRN